MTLNAISSSSPLYEAGKNSSASSCSGLLAEIRTPSGDVINLMPLYFSLDKTETLLKVSEKSLTLISKTELSPEGITC